MKARAATTRAAVQRALRWLGWLRAVSWLGRLVIVGGAAAWFLGWKLGWEELMVVAAGCVVVMILAALYSFGGDPLSATIGITPQRLVVGTDAVGRLIVVNPGARRTLPARIEATVGAGIASFDIASIAAGQVHEEIFVVPTRRRCVMRIGPVRFVRGDPLGLIRREVALSESLLLYVHPVTVNVPRVAAGWLRDLEGNTTNDRSLSDVAFHTLREYVPGDDRRHVHWRTSARIGRLMVRQYVDNRRSELAIILVTARLLFSNDAEFELAVSVAGSIGVSAARGDQKVTCFAGSEAIPAHSPQRLLDGLAAVEADNRRENLRTNVQAALPKLANASVVAIICGSGVSLADLRSATNWFPASANMVAFRCEADGAPAFKSIGTNVLLTVGHLDDVNRLLRRTASVR